MCQTSRFIVFVFELWKTFRKKDIGQIERLMFCVISLFILRCLSELVSVACARGWVRTGRPPPSSTSPPWWCPSTCSPTLALSSLGSSWPTSLSWPSLCFLVSTGTFSFKTHNDLFFHHSMDIRLFLISSKSIPRDLTSFGSYTSSN